jgi:hypothetical protein
MITETFANQLAACVIFAWAVFCIFSVAVNDGVIGKIIYSAVALSAFGIATGPHDLAQIARTETILHCAIAAVGARHLFMKLFWSKIKRQYVAIALANEMNCSKIIHLSTHARRRSDKAL